MERYAGSLLGRVELRFDESAAYVPADLSAAAHSPRGKLVVAADERASVETLEPGENPLIYEQCATRPLNDDLGIGRDDEVDIEGFAFSEDEGELYLAGSHSAKRKKPKHAKKKDDLERLATIRVEPSRFVLGRVTIRERDGRSRLEDLAQMQREGEGALLDALSDDPHLGPFLPTRDDRMVVPGKDNGFDIEGLALREGRVLLGLRGPVLRGWAFILELELDEPSPGVLELKSQGKHRYRKHAVNLDGLGVRELIVHGDDVLIMAGPTMALDGVHRMFRWCGGPRKGNHTVVDQETGKLEPVFDVPFLPARDRAEALASHSWFGPNDSILVLYDTPSEARRRDQRSVLGDVFAV